MDNINDAIDPALVKFGAGQSVTRKRTPPCCAGEAAIPTTSMCRARLTR